MPLRTAKRWFKSDRAGMSIMVDNSPHENVRVDVSLVPKVQAFGVSQNSPHSCKVSAVCDLPELFKGGGLILAKSLRLTVVRKRGG